MTVMSESCFGIHATKGFRGAFQDRQLRCAMAPPCKSADASKAPSSDAPAEPTTTPAGLPELLFAIAPSGLTLPCQDTNTSEVAYGDICNSDCSTATPSETDPDEVTLQRSCTVAFKARFRLRNKGLAELRQTHADEDANSRLREISSYRCRRPTVDVQPRFRLGNKSLAKFVPPPGLTHPAVQVRASCLSDVSSDLMRECQPGQIFQHEASLRRECPFLADPASNGAMLILQESHEDAGIIRHLLGLCRPCDFENRDGCRLGAGCTFCHLCSCENNQRRENKRSNREKCWVKAAISL